jgi:glycosyltransferase involved in cell wall biosynthesis
VPAAEGGSPIRRGVRPRAVLLVADPAAPYSRGLRVARSLAAAGYDVEIAAVVSPGLPAEERDGDVLLRRYAPSGRWARWSIGREGVARRVPQASAGSGSGSPGRHVSEGSAHPSTLRRPARRLRRLPALALKVALWPLNARAWWATLRRELPPADLYHAFGILAIPVALDLAADARRRGRRGAVVYDVIDVILESNNYARVPAPILAIYHRREAGWVRRSDAIVTVNEPIADHIAASWPVAVRPTVLPNCQPRWTPPDPRPDLIRAVTGIPPGRRVVLFLGRLGRERGLEEAAEAVLRLDDAALVMLGFGPWADELRRRDTDQRFAGRHFTLPAVHPDDVPGWTASADASIVAVPANSLNQRLSTPNKFWESLTAGTPVVVGRDLEVMRGIVEEGRLGSVGDPADPGDLARALASIVDAPPEERRAMRERCLAITRERYNWETAVVPYLQLVDRLVGG